MDRMEVSIEGPYGPPSTHFLKVFVYTHLKLFFLKKTISIVLKFVSNNYSVLIALFIET